MEDKDIEQLIDKKIADAKLEVAEKRIHFLLTIGAALLVILGIAFPILLGFRTADRVDKAIDKMERKFEQLAGKQLREPEMACYIDGKALVNAVVRFDPKNKERVIELKNIGGRTADFINLRLYLNNDDDDFISDIQRSGWHSLEINDKPEFKIAFGYFSNVGVLLPADSFLIKFWMFQQKQWSKDIKTIALLKVMYGEPTPLEVPFTIEVKKE